MLKIRLYFLMFVLSFFSFKNIGNESIFNFKVDYFDVDILGNLYLVRESELVKYDAALERQSTFSDLSLGEITSIDASDAMNLLVYYEDFGSIIFLDNTLSIKKSAISLADLGFSITSLACLSYNNAFWIFDPVNQELIRINQFLEITERSGNLNQIINTEIEPDQLFEAGNNVYLKDRKEGVFIFDRYAGYLKRLPFLAIDDLQFIEPNNLAFLRSDTLFTYNMNTINMDTMTLLQKGVKKIMVNSDSYFYLGKKGMVYRESI